MPVVESTLELVQKVCIFVIVRKVENELKDAQTKLESTDTELKQKQQAQKTAEDELNKAEDNRKKVAGDFDRYAKLTAQKRWKWHDTVRDWPVLDAFASPIRIQQFTLAEYPIDYSFKYVTRFVPHPRKYRSISANSDSATRVSAHLAARRARRDPTQRSRTCSRRLRRTAWPGRPPH